MLKIPYASLTRLLDRLVDGNGLDSITLHLYSNNHTPANADTAADYTEATFPGYTEAAVTGWDASAFISPRARTEADLVEFTAGTSPNQTIYGYYITDDLDGDGLLWAEKFAASIVVNVTGQEFAVLPRFTLKSEG